MKELLAIWGPKILAILRGVGKKLFGWVADIPWKNLSWTNLKPKLKEFFNPILWIRRFNKFVDIMIQVMAASFLFLLVMGIFMKYQWKIDWERFKRIVEYAQKDNNLYVEGMEAQRKKFVESYDMKTFDERIKKYEPQIGDPVDIADSSRPHVEILTQNYNRLVAERDRIENIRINLLHQLDKRAKDISEQGFKDMLDNFNEMEPEQIKDQLVLWYEDDDKKDLVVATIQNLPNQKRGALFEEFATPDEIKMLAEIQYKIKMGNPYDEVIKASYKEMRGMADPPPLPPAPATGPPTPAVP